MSLDAMGAQKNIAQKIYLAQADYLLALKGNYSNLHKRVEAFFSSPSSIKNAQNRGHIISTCDVKSKGHGRIEKRVVMATDAIDWMDKNERESWLGYGVSFV